MESHPHRRRRLLMVLVTTALVVGAVYAIVTLYPRPSLPLRGTIGQYHTAALDLGYQASIVVPGEYGPGTEPGLYIKRRGDVRPWGELACGHQVAPRRARGYAVVRRLSPFVMLAADDYLVQVGEYSVEGDPSMIAELVGAMR